jgi:endonuclease YncB( thermonuclease family)
MVNPLSYMMNTMSSTFSVFSRTSVTSMSEHNVQDTMDLLQRTKQNTPLFSLEGREFDAKVVYIYDGDTMHVVFKVFGDYHRWNCRIVGVDTPELRTKNEMGYKVRDVIREKLMDKLVRVKCGEFDKYGRLLLDVYMPDEHRTEGKETETLSEWLIENKYAYSYDGGTKQSWDEINFIA